MFTSKRIPKATWFTHLFNYLICQSHTATHAMHSSMSTYSLSLSLSLTAMTLRMVCTSVCCLGMGGMLLE